MYWDTKKRKGMHYYAVIVKEWGGGLSSRISFTSKPIIF
jgi:hypothetical protein